MAKSKKRQHSDIEDSPDDINDANRPQTTPNKLRKVEQYVEVVELVKKKKKKKISKPENSLLEEVENVACDSIVKKSKRKKKKKKKTTLEGLHIEDSPEKFESDSAENRNTSLKEKIKITEKEKYVKEKIDVDTHMLKDTKKKKHKLKEGNGKEKEQGTDDIKKEKKKKKEKLKYSDCDDIMNDSDNLINSMKEDTEHNKEWRIRKIFLSQYIDTVSLPRLKSLSKCLINIVFHDCSYPKAVMDELMDKCTGSEELEECKKYIASKDDKKQNYVTITDFLVSPQKTEEESPLSKTKQKNQIKLAEIEFTNIGEKEISDILLKKKKKKKRKTSDIEFEKESNGLADNNNDEGGESLLKKNKKKKSKAKYNDLETYEMSKLDESSKNKKIKKKKRKSKDDDSLDEDIQTEDNDIKNQGDDSDSNRTSLKGKTAKKSKKKKKKNDEKNDSIDNQESYSFQNKTSIALAQDLNDQKHSLEDAEVQGQWQGKLFEEEERQNKFLRLLGGMKKTSSEVEVAPTAKKAKGLFDSSKTNKNKGLFGSLTKSNKGKGLFGSLSSSTSVSNVAMSVDTAKTLNNNLESEFNKALALRLSGGLGLGLGFTKDPAEGKKFHIDTTKVNSKVFDE